MIIIFYPTGHIDLLEMNIFLKSLLVVMVSWVVVKAAPLPDDGPPSNWDQKEFWTPCESDYLNPLGACRQYGFSITRTPDGGFTKAKQVDRWWSGGGNKCSDAPPNVRFFCSKVYTKAYWQGTCNMLQFHCELLNFATSFPGSKHFSEKLIEIDCKSVCFYENNIFYMEG